MLGGGSGTPWTQPQGHKLRTQALGSLLYQLRWREGGAAGVWRTRKSVELNLSLSRCFGKRSVLDLGGCAGARWLSSAAPLQFRV